MNLSEFQGKQKEIELQHQITVNKIKGEIWTDRQSFLQKIIKLEENHKVQQKIEDEAGSQMVQESMQEGILKKKKHQKPKTDTEEKSEDKSESKGASQNAV